MSEPVPGIDLERPGAQSALAELEAAVAASAPYRDIASRLHLMARRGAVNAGGSELGGGGQQAWAEGAGSGP